MTFVMFRRFMFVKQTNTILFSTSSSLLNLSSSMKKLIDAQKYQQALDLFHQNSKYASDVAINLALTACTKLKNLEEGITIHQHLSPQSMNNSFINTSLIHLYMTCGDENNAFRVFNSIKNKTSNVYGAMFKGFITNNKPEKVFELYDQMLIEPDDINLILLFNACAQLPNEHALKIRNKYIDLIPKLFISTHALNSFLYMLMKFGDISTAQSIFAQIKTKNIVTYGVMMQGFFDSKMFEKTLDVFEQMPFSPDDIISIILFKTCTQLSNERALKLGKNVFNQLPKKFYKNSALITSTLHMLMNFGDTTNAEKLFNDIDRKNIFYYGAMMDGYNINNEPEKCLKIFNQMQQNDIVPNVVIITLALGACSQIGSFSLCRSIVDQIPSYLLNNHRLQNTLIDAWAKVGLIDKALQIFKDVKNPDNVTFTTMINGFGLNGMGHEAIDLYQQVPVDFQDEITYICVLNACSHSGLVDEAYSIFDEAKMKTTKIVTTMVDCLSRMFMFDEAQKLIDNYELSHPPCVVMYMALLSGARNHRNFTLSQKIFDRMNYLFPDQKEALISGSVLLSNTYSSIGEDEQAKEVRFNRLKQIGKNSVIGMAWTEANGQLVKFKAGDCSHPQSKQIYDEIARMSCELIQHGHQYNSSWITRELHDNETIESVLCSHSEKLAIAFNFIQQPIPNVIQVTKNLRVCGDCHSAVKLIAKIRQRPIIIRDANRFHHFNINGQCSCQDHF